MPTISLDLRERILATYAANDDTRETVARRFRVSLGFVKKLLQQRRRIGEVRAQHPRSGCKPRLVASQRQPLRTRLKQKPDLTRKELRAATGLDCTLPAIHYVLVKLGLTDKKRRSAPAHRTGPTSGGRGKPGGDSRPALLRHGSSSSMKRARKRT